MLYEIHRRTFTAHCNAADACSTQHLHGVSGKFTCPIPRQHKYMPLAAFILSILLSVLPLCHQVAAAPIVQPGAPGETSRLLSADVAIQIANTSHTPDDIQFMQDMMVHHQQALDMAVLAKDRTNFPGSSRRLRQDRGIASR
jgi:hypothetical protein